MLFTIILVILGIALGVVYFNREKDEEKAKLGILGLSMAIVVLSLLRLLGVGSGAPAQSAYDVSVDRQIGEVMADRIAQVAQGKRVVIVGDAQTTNPFASAQIEAFQQRLSGHGLQVVAVESPWPQSLVDSGESFSREGLDGRALGAALDQHPEAEMLVSLAGFPLLNYNAVERRLERVEFYVFDDHGVSDWQGAVARGVVDGLIVQTPDADWTDTTGSGKEIFDRRYVFVTRDNLAEIRQMFPTGHEW